MDFRFTDEQGMLAETATAFLAEVSDSAATRRAMTMPEGFDQSVWQRVVEEMGWQGILVPEAQDGLDLGFVELVVVLEKMGERLHVSPLYASAVSTVLLRRLPASDARDDALAALASGAVVSLAHSAVKPNWGVGGIAIDAQCDDQDWVLNGECRFIPVGQSAAHLLLAARLDQGDIGIFLVDPATEGLQVSALPTMDQTRSMASATLTDVRLSASMCLSQDAGEALTATLDIARILVAADQTGGAQACLDSSVAYVMERVQFGRQIASYQAIKHKAADMMVKVESARSLLYYAACMADEWLLGEADSAALAEAAAMVSASASDAYFFCAGTGIQLHGGVGITEEYDIQLYFKRARSTESYLGSPAEQRERVAASLLDGD